MDIMLSPFQLRYGLLPIGVDAFYECRRWTKLLQTLAKASSIID
ncbi:MAG: hypothetical protein NZ805_03525 [Armatimonadetes bacterium]|nr:hypothetical protein [Armatimonadota bacterium]MDW8028081.1 hypothetical protein [Armatimonadota bacterium]